MEEAKKKYERREGRYNKLLQKQKKAEGLISNLRLLVFIIAIVVAVFMYMAHNYIFMAASLVLFAAIFLYFVARHGKLIGRIKYTTILKNINTQSLERLKGEWNIFPDDGGDFKADGHNYSGDLDIFGKSSLFQWINTAKTFFGRRHLKDILSGVVGNRIDIVERQEAVSELAALLTWRQRFLAEGMIASDKMRDPETLIRWAKESNPLFRKPWVIAILRIVPTVTVLLVLFGLIINKIPWYWPTAALIVHYGLLSYQAKERHGMFTICENYNVDLRIYYKMLRLIERQNFKSALGNKIKADIRSAKGQEAYRQVDKLSAIIDSISDRRNAFYFIFNLLTLWDFQTMIALEAWKSKSGQHVKDWLNALGHMEALASLAIIPFDHTDWAIPRIEDGADNIFEAKEMGHPLLWKTRVHNDLNLADKAKVLLITGSNMSGKSTFLRTAGINLVLAYAGAPVCARTFRTTIMTIHTCMRVSDNLEESISSFYAELLRIKDIVSEAKAGKNVFFLLDEIFKGTNSTDRHAGARVLISKLSHTNSIGMVSTHDLELCDLEQQSDKIANYHFQEYYEEGKIQFDYMLRQGPSTTRNALYLMQLAGIEIEE